MLKWMAMEIVFREIPDEITLAINISGCPIRCPDCHSKYLWKDVGNPLTIEQIEKGLRGVTCVCFMGGNPTEIVEFAKTLKHKYKDLKIGYYCGYEHCPIPVYDNLEYFDYVKIGPFIKERGPLDNPNTNQHLYRVKKLENGFILYSDIKLWKS